MSTNLIATIQSINDHQLAKIINQACFPFSLATNLLTNHGVTQEQITRNCIDHHSKSKSRENNINYNIKFKSKEIKQSNMNLRQTSKEMN